MSTEDIAATLGAGALIFHNQQVLLVQMNYGRAKGSWILPGGMVSIHEHPHEAAIRETKEETGLDIKTQGQVAVRNRRFADGNANVYWVFRGQLLHPFKNEDLSFDPEELLDVRFWDIQHAMKANEVRPMTRLYIKMGLNMQQDHHLIEYSSEQPLNSTQDQARHDDYIYGVPL